MTSRRKAIPSEATTNGDGWDHHWQAYGAAARRNPANAYRHDLILRLLGTLPTDATLLDIGSGQGEFAISLKQLYPHVRVSGVENSESGVALARDAAEAAGVDVSFFQRDLLQPVPALDEYLQAQYAVCSEVLEHVADPVLLLRNATALLQPGATVVVTVPGGPRSAFDRHIGHHQHFTAPLLRQVLGAAGFDVQRVLRAGFPGFNLYKLAVIARGRKLIADVESRSPTAPASSTQARVARMFSSLFTLNRDDSRFGWQLAAVATLPGPEA